MKTKLAMYVLVVGALALAAVFGLSAFRAAYAQSATPAAPATNPNQTNPKNPGMLGRGGFEGANHMYLAQALGITTDQLSTAYQTAYKAALDAAVKAGQITQSQADQMASNAGGMPFGVGRDWMQQSGIDFNALLAQALGITTDKLNAAYKSAYNAQVDAAVSAGNLTAAQADLMKGEFALRNSTAFQNSMQSAYKAAVQQAVTDGTLTQAQADAILANSNGFGERGLLGVPGLGGPGGFGGGRGGHGGPFGGPQGGMPNGNPTSPQTPSGTAVPGTIQ